jgi:group I intron endonuclease
MLVYCIKNLNTGKKYVGFTKHTTDRRFNQHKQAAAAGSQYQLHQSIRKHGIEAFSIEVLEEVTEENQSLREQYWIETLNTFYKGYNMTLGGEGTKGIKRNLFGQNNPMYGKKHSVSSIEKNRKSNLEHILKNGSHKHSEKTKKIISEKKSKTWNVIDANGNSFTINNLWQFCKDKNLDACHLYKVAQGKLKQHKGYKCYEVDN